MEDKLRMAERISKDIETNYDTNKIYNEEIKVNVKAITASMVVIKDAVTLFEKDVERNEDRMMKALVNVKILVDNLNNDYF